MPHMPRALCALAVVLLLGACTQTVYAQASERQMVVSVVDANGAPASGLGPADFIVREDGVAREVLRVSPRTGSRQIALLIDTSQAAGPVLGDLKRAAGASVESMSDGNEISIISFGGTPRILADATTDLDKLRDGVGRIFAFSETASYLLDAVSETTQGFRRRAAERPVLVVLTTLGVDYSNIDARTLLHRLEESRVAVYTVVLLQGETAVGGSTTPRGDIVARGIERDFLLDQGPAVSGGRRWDLQISASAERAMVDLATDLRSQYLIVYSRPDALIPPERIDVEVTRAGLDARGTPSEE